jgi:hypothetical protein
MIRSYACELELPATMQIHLVFNVNLLCPTADNPAPRQWLPPLLPVEVEGIEQFEVKEVVNLF